MLNARPSPRGSAPEAAGFTDQTAWTRLTGTLALENGLGAWLALQCALIGHVSAALVLLDTDRGEPLKAVWPEGAQTARLASPLETARTRQRGVLEASADTDSHLIAFPVLLGGAPVGAVALEVEPRPADVLRLSMRHLQWGVAWLREKLVAEQLAKIQSDEAAGRVLLDLLAAGLEPEAFKASARSVAIGLSERFGCERVSIGMVHGARVEVVAISHSASFGKDMNLVRMVGEAMDEAVDQRAVVAWPPAPGVLMAVRIHEQLIRAHGSAVALTVPMPLRDGFVGAITLERGSPQPFTLAEARLLDMLATVLAPVLEEKRLNDRLLVIKARDAALEQVARLFGPRHAVRKAVLAAALALLVLFTFWHETYRVTTDAVVEGQIQRAMTVSFDGFLREAPARAGDQVREGELLASLDDRELVLERLRWSTERQRRAFEYERALGERNRGELRLITNQIEQADAQIQLIDAQIARARLTAPFDGLVVSGDHSQSIGASVQRGQVLFEITPNTGHRVVLSVDEAQVADLKEGQRGQLVLAALPGESFPVEVVRITPVAKAEEGRNQFRVEAKLLGPTEAFRPGMRGVAKIEVDRRRTLWVWTRGLLDWVRLALWRWLP
ncbi:efflux RND transporter periplasmic adaptor subunit [Roseixanthobacter liquoris]|uniref:efflux RND transporter periplasmic adaptor subunit n=1 Tax=Roseixanthobacter liquoris TaxID=3119921 RepID=UPI003726BF64